MKPLIPMLSVLPERKMLTITSVGDPNLVMEKNMKALYGTAYGTKMKVYKPKGLVMSLGKLTAHWPDAHLKPKAQWTGIWGVEVPEFVTASDLLQKDPQLPVKLEVWEGGDFAEILHLGPYSEEGPSVQKLHDYIAETGHAIAGPHEEEYLTSPDAKLMKTIIRYKIKKK